MNDDDDGESSILTLIPIVNNFIFFLVSIVIYRKITSLSHKYAGPRKFRSLGQMSWIVSFLLVYWDEFCDMAAIARSNMDALAHDAKLQSGIGLFLEE